MKTTTPAGGDPPSPSLFQLPETDLGSSVRMMTITDDEFQAIRRLVYDRFGINLTEQKRSLVVGRLQKVLRTYGFSSFAHYFDHLLKDPTGKVLSELVNRLSTNHTFFGREQDHFDFFVKTALPEAVLRHKERRSRDLRVWSAGCSSGEEPYTLVMLMMEYFGTEYRSWNAGILATDISATALETAREGVYPEERLKLLSEALKRKYFRKASEGQWTVVEEVKRELTFRRFNLMNRTFPFKKSFDIIFCRNVMIYFDQKTRDELVSRFYQWTMEGGYFFIGHSESLRRDRCPYEYVMPAVYRKRG